MSFAYTEEEGIFLVTLARKALTTYLEFKKRIPIPPETPPKLKNSSGVFVTLNIFDKSRINQQLRGCIGRPLPEQPLVQATIDSAIDSGTEDPRFHRVGLKELEDIQFEVTALTPPEVISVKSEEDLLNAIEIGVHGLLLQADRKYWNRAGLFLPQVPIEWKWSKTEYLNELCGKAGLSEEAWHDLEHVHISRFAGEIFQEELPKGKIVRYILVPEPN
jgi:uncharacterized protein (TIGR00296 family)